MQEKKSPVWIATLVVAVVVVAAGAYFLFFRGKGKEELPIQEVAEPQTSPAPVEITPAAEQLPEPIQIALGKSDAIARELAGRISSNPTFLTWLATDDLIRKFVAAVDNIALGTSPKPHLIFMAPEDPFSVIQKKDRVLVSPESYRRYNLVANVFTSVDTKGSVEAYRRLRLPIQEAYRELGYPDRDFNDTLAQAIVELLRVPVVREPIRLRQKVISFAMTDPELEGLSAAQKNLLRMGPDNVQRIQNKLREFAAALGIPASRLP
jgi:hypothetical protein